MMADEIVKGLKVKVSDDGTVKKTTKSVKDLNKNLDNTTASAKKAEKQIKQLNKTGAGGTAASRKALESAQTTQKAQHQQFDRARGVSAASGAAARDFANQSRGLGGLVRLYATFAANLFALGAAFRALSGAMDTSNMVKGLDQLGAAVGRNLGGLSKELVEISGGAISLAQAMKAVAQTSTGGLSGENIKRLGGVARTAAAALGVAMPDAVNRLSRAITKLEPELLDELGIMTRLEPAVDIYARQLGKASSQLTQFERRQAFANAVLAEGEEKFGAIEDIPINAFDVMASSVKDLTQDIAAFLNEGLVPVIQLLSSNPTALLTGMAALVGIIAKQAISVVFSLKAAFAATAASAAEAAAVRVAEAKQAVVELKKLDAEELANIQLRADKEVAIQRKLVADLLRAGKKTNEASLFPRTRLENIARQDIARNLIKVPVEELDSDKIAFLRKRAKALKGINVFLDAESVALNKVADSLQRELETGRAATKVVLDRTIATSANTTLQKIQTEGQVLQVQATRAQIVADLQAQVTTIGKTAALQGANAAITKLNASMVANNVTMGFWTNQMFKARIGLASLAVATTFLGKAVGFLFSALIPLTLALLAFEGLKSVFSGNAEAVKDFESAIDDAESATKNMNRTLKLMADKGLKGSIGGIVATANAFDGLATSINAVIETSRKAQEDATFIDGITDAFFSFFNSGIEDDLNEQLSKLTLGAIQGLDQTGLKEVGQKQFREILGITDIDSELNQRTITEAIGNLGEEGQNKLRERLKETGQELQNTASRMESFKTATVAANLAFAQLIQSTASNDPIFRLGVTMQGLSASMIKVSTSGSLLTEQIDAIVQNISQNSDSAILFGPQTVANILEVKDEIEALNEAKKELARIDKQLSSAAPGALSKDSNELKTITKDGIEIVLSDQFLTVFEQLTKQRAAAVEVANSQEEISAKSAKIFRQALNESFERGAKLIAQASGQAQEKASLALRKASLGGLSGEQRAREQLAISRREIDIRIEAVNTSIQLITSQEALRATIEENTASNARDAAVRRGADPKELQELNDALAAAKIFAGAFNKEGGFSIAGIQELIDALGEGVIKDTLKARAITPQSQIAGQDATRTILNANKTAAAIKGEAAIRKGIQEDAAKLANTEIKILETRQQSISNSITIAGFATKELAEQKAILDISVLLIQQDIARKASQVDISNASIESERIKREELASQQLINQELVRQNLFTQIAIDGADAGLAQSRVTRELNIATGEERFALENGLLDVQQAQNQAAASRFGLSDSVVARLQQEVDIASLVLATERARVIAAAELEAVKLRGALEIANLDAQGESGAADAARARTKLANDIKAGTIRLRTIATTAALEEKTLRTKTKATRELDRQNRLLKTSAKLAADLGKTFGSIGKSIGSLTTTFSKFLTNFEKSQGSIDTLLKDREKLAQQDKLDSEEGIQNQKDLTVARSESVLAQLDGFSALAGAGKSFFDGQSEGYKILSAIEKTFAVLSIALKFERAFADTSATVIEISNTGSRITAKVVEAEVDGVAAVVKTLSSLPFPANLAAGAAVAAVVAVLMSAIGGKSPKVNSSGFTAESVQEVQGTGSKFVNGQKVSRPGGVLGDNEAVVNDIALSLDLIEASTGVTSKFGVKSIKLLSLIEANTRELAIALIGSTDISKRGSGFGTETGTSFKKGFNPIDAGGKPILALFDAVGLGVITDTINNIVSKIPLVGGLLSGIGGFISKIFGTKKKISVIDKGVLATGKLADFLDQTKVFQEFETLKITKKKFLGKKKTSFQINTKDLDRTASEEFIKLFSNLVDVSVLAAKEAFGESNTSIQRALDTFQIDFKVSGFELKGQEFADAILAESNVIINQLIGVALPALRDFREIGEGYAATLLRVASIMAVADTKIGRLGISLEQLEKRTQTTADVLAGIEPSRILRFTVDLVEAFGGLEDFIEKTDFLFENFFSEDEQIAAKTSEVNAAFVRLREEGVITGAQLSTLTDGVGELRLEFREVALGLLTAEGAVGEAANAFISLAPAVVAISDEVENLGTGLNTLASIIKSVSDDLKIGFKDLLEEAVTGSLDTSEIGGRVSTLINDTFALALSDSLTNDITGMIVDQLLTPILTGALTATTITSFSIGAVMDDLAEKAGFLVASLNDPRIRTALATVAIATTKLIKGVTESLEGLTFTFSSLRLDELTQQVKDLAQQINERVIDDAIASEQTRLDLLREQATILEGSSGQFKEFSRSIEEFRISLLTGTLSPLTPQEKLGAAEENFTRLLALSADASNPEEQVAALGQLQGAATTLLDTGRVFLSSSSQFTDLFNFVQDQLSSVSLLTEGQASIDQQQLNGINTQITALESSLEVLEEQRDSLNNIEFSIEELTAQLTDAVHSVAVELAKAADQIVVGFTILDTDFSGLLSLDELEASGLASREVLANILETLDTNGDSQLSALEAIQGSTSSAAFGTQNLLDVLAAVNAGELTLEEGQSQIQSFQAANTSVGAEETLSSFATDNEFSLSGGEIVGTNTVIQSASGTAVIGSDSLTGIDGQVISLAAAKDFLDQAADDIINGLQSARSVFETLRTIGVTSSQVAQILDNGITADGVVQFFQEFDPSIPSFARGINSVPEDMLAQIHQGERILPKADNDELLTTLANKRVANAELVAEVKKLNEQMQLVEAAITESTVTKEVATMLGQIVEGNLVNAQAIVEATMQAAEEGAKVVAESNGDLAAQEVWRKRSLVEIR